MKKQTNKQMKIEKSKKLSVFFLIGILSVIFVMAAPSFHTSGTVSNLSEDQSPVFTYNLSANVTNSQNETLIFEFVNITVAPSLGLTNVSYYNWISIVSSTGILTINSTRNNETGYFNISVFVHNPGGQGQSEIFYFNVTAVNDAPVFVNLENKTFNMSEVFNYLINISDEENNIPFTINISFLNCSVAEWSIRNCSNSSGRELFNSSYYNFNSTSGVLNISFTPLKDDVGSYVINFSVMDNSGLGNRTTNKIVNFSVLNTNSAPYFRYICNNERNATENFEFTCWINASDSDEIYNMTFSSNYSWFTFYNSSSRVVSISFPCNISTSYNASAMINFTANDSMVGNWSINLTITDIGSGNYAPKRNSSVFWFFINNTEDIVSLDEISNITVYENQTIYVNASDNDLLVPDKNVKNEVLTFKSNASWVNISTYSNASNYVTAKIDINFNGISVGNYTIKINVTDSAGNYADRNFTIRVLGDSPAVWNASMSDVFVIYENNLSYWNFTQNITDVDGDSINFSFVNYTSFPSFSINRTTGIINFTPVDSDVGYHNITINASDGKLNSLKSFNFTVYNVNDNLSINPLNSSGVLNATSVDAGSNIICAEDSVVTIPLWIHDDDLRIPSNQKSFYNESFDVSVNITGVNSSLFSFSRTSSFPTAVNPNRMEYTAIFTPKKADVGIYNITINVTDASGFSRNLTFNLTVSGISHNPVLVGLQNKTTSINRNLFYQINASDIEDGDSNFSGGNSNFTFSYNFISGTNFLNSSIFNITSGILNITFNSSQEGKYHINITVNDSSGAIDFDSFWIYVYGIPNITFPATGYVFNLAENTLSNLTFRANHSVLDNLTFKFYIQNTNGTDQLKYNLSYYGNDTNLTWQFTPNFTDETQGTKNLTLVVINPIYSDLNFSIGFNITINHTNAPVIFSGHLGDSQADYSNVITINLSNYFSDIDYSDVYYNQTISFNVSSNSTASSITSSISNWTLTLSSSVAVTEILNITAIDSNSSNITSNNFEVKFTTPASVAVNTPSSGGGGGGGSTTPVAFKIITPGTVSAYAYEKIIIPLSLENKGNKNFDKISITSVAFKDGDIQNKVTTSLDKSYISSLKINSIENLILTVFFDTNKTGDYEILINASAQSPKYTDWAKIYINLQETNGSDVKELLIFTEEFIAENPECIEITEILNEARDYFEKEDFINARQKAEQAINACRNSISQPGLASFKLSSPFSLNQYLMIATIGSMILGIVYYSIRRIRLKKNIKFVVVEEAKDKNS